AIGLGVPAGVGSARPGLAVLLAGLAAGVLAATAWAAAAAGPGRRVADEPALAALTLSPVVATVPSGRFRQARRAGPGGRTPPLEVCDSPASPGTGMFHAVAAALHHPGANGPLVVGVTSPSGAERRESFAANVAAAAAQ